MYYGWNFASFSMVLGSASLRGFPRRVLIPVIKLFREPVNASSPTRFRLSSSILATSPVNRSSLLPESSKRRSFQQQRKVRQTKPFSRKHFLPRKSSSAASIIQNVCANFESVPLILSQIAQDSFTLFKTESISSRAEFDFLNISSGRLCLRSSFQLLYHMIQMRVQHQPERQGL